jgi:UPF0755 protein
MKRLVLILISIFTLLGAIVYGNVWWRNVNMPISKNQEFQDFLIVRGTSANEIGNDLEEEGLIKDALAFKVYSQITGKSKKIQAGEYRLSPSMTLSEIVNQLTLGPVELWVTIPEGFRAEQVAERFIDILGKEGQEATTFRQEFLAEADGFEGFLFPDTYLFPKTIEASSVVSKLRSTFDARIAEFEEDIAASSLTLDEIVILASIIERETKTDVERPVVAGILINRLEEGMGLQADATVQYAVASVECQGESGCEWWPTVTRQDLELASPYNTYKYRGLPPAPIANPGTSSLRAAIYPEETTYFYYLHEPSGQIHYAETLDEHNDNVRRYLGR